VAVQTGGAAPDMSVLGCRRRDQRWPCRKSKPSATYRPHSRERAWE